MEVSTPEGQRWRYTYDAFGRRLAKCSSSANIAYQWDGQTLAAEWLCQADGTTGAQPMATIYHYALGTHTLLALERTGELYPVVTDHLGTPKALCDEEGKVIWNRSHRVWGAIGTHVRHGGWESLWQGNGASAANDPLFHCPIGFLGQYEDIESGLFYNFHRYYDATTGQYLSSDPIGLAGGLRTRGYVENPLTWVDPLGLNGCAGANSADSFFNDLPLIKPRSLNAIDPAPGQFQLTESTLGKLSANEPYIYVIDAENGVQVAARGSAGASGVKHTQLSGGAAVRGAGELIVTNENTVLINNLSGRYRAQSPEAVTQMQKYLEQMKLNVKVIKEEF